MVAKFIEESIMFQNDTIFLLYGIIVVVAYGIAFLMYQSAKKKTQK